MLRLVLAHACPIAGLAFIAGLLLCWPAGRGRRGFLFGAGVLNAHVWILAPSLLLLVSLLAALSPAVRAAKTDPTGTLQAE